MEIVWLYIKLGSKQHHIIDLDLFFTIANKKGFAQETGLLIYDLRWHEVVLVRALLVSLGGLLLLIVRDIAAVGLSVFNLVGLFVRTFTSKLALSSSSLCICLVRLICSLVLVSCVGASASQLSSLPLL